MPREPADERGTDWTGVQPDDSPIEPLDERTFILRLRMLGERARDLTLLRRARNERQPHDRRVHRDSE